jgi:ribosomal protein S18 acetylase RimI-like enzyme
MDIEITAGGQWAEELDGLLRGLPEWFGIEASIVDYVESARSLPSFAARVEGEVVGVCVVRHHNPLASEIEVLAIRRDHHRRGVGLALMAAVEQDLQRRGAMLLQVKTRGPSAPSPEYERTRAFYEAMGFIPLEERHDIWGPQDPCLIMVKPLGSARGNPWR